MTASERYTLLEAEADYFDGHSARGHRVLLKFGRETLTLLDSQFEPLGQWPLGSIRRQPGTKRGDLVMRLLPDFGADARLVIRDPDMMAAIEEVCTGLDARGPADHRSNRRLMMWGIGAVISVLITLFGIVPLIADRVAATMPPEREVALGAKIDQQLRRLLTLSGQNVRSCTDTDGVAALNKLVARVAGPVRLPYPLQVEVVEHKMVNAMNLPGGRIIFLSGLIEKAESPEEVAGVLAHELAHAEGRDPLRGALRGAGIGAMTSLIFGDLSGGLFIGVAADAALNGVHSRAVESHADDRATALLTAAGLPTLPFAAFMNRVAKDGGGWFDSHPAGKARAAAIAQKDTIGEGGKFTPVLSPTEWKALRRICGKDPKVSPSKS